MAGGFIAWDAFLAFVDFEDDLIEMNEVEEETAFRRMLRDVTNPFECPEASFRSYFRLTRELAWDLCEWLRPHLGRRRRHGLTVERQVLAALRFYATGSNQGAVGQDMNISVSQPSISRAVRRVSAAINETLLREFVRFPNTEAERNEAKAAFEVAPEPFLGAMGAIDCTHIAIIAPKEHEEAYVNHRGFHSMNVQMVCDPSFKILDVCARFPGARHDAFKWNASPLRENMSARYTAGERNTFLLGDSGYSLEPWLMTPIPDAAQGTPYFRYTSAHCKARSVIERCFGILKGVFYCPSRKRILLYNPVTSGSIINACVVLHNLRLKYNIEADEDEIEPAEDGEGAFANDARDVGARNRLAEGRRVREAYIRRHFQ